jgi:hypothetical protein
MIGATVGEAYVYSIVACPSPVQLPVELLMLYAE